MKDLWEGIYLNSEASMYLNMAQKQSHHKVQISRKLIINSFPESILICEIELR